MSTGQNLLDRLELLHPELQVQPGEDGVTKGLTALNMAQDYLESVLALHPMVMGDGIDLVFTVAGQEWTVFPNTLLRLDALWLCNGPLVLPPYGDYVGVPHLMPSYEIEILQRVGGHRTQAMGLTGLLNASSRSGPPVAAHVDGRAFYWDPLPDAVYQVRWYGLKSRPDITATDIFSYPDMCMTPLATLAARLIRVGLDDSAEQLKGVADELFTPVIAAMKGFRRDRPQTLTYSRVHVT